MDLPESWKRFLKILQADRSHPLVYVLGPIDTGKTSLCRFLLEQHPSAQKIALVDCDPGQSILGLPTTLAMMVYQQQAPIWEAPLLRFIGATTPFGHLLQTQTAIKRLVEKARESQPDLILLDSSGFVLGNVAREFQFQTLDLIQPAHLVALQRSKELEPILANFSRHPKMQLHRLEVPESVVVRTPPERRIYREQKFKQYFQDAKMWELNFRQLGLHGRVPEANTLSFYKNRLVALCDAENFAMALGIIYALDWPERKMKFWAPQFDSQNLASIHFGSIALELTGRQLMFRPPSPWRRPSRPRRSQLPGAH